MKITLPAVMVTALCSLGACANGGILDPCVPGPCYLPDGTQVGARGKIVKRPPPKTQPSATPVKTTASQTQSRSQSESWEDMDASALFRREFTGIWNTDRKSCNKKSGFEVVVSIKDIKMTDYEFGSETPYCKVRDIGPGNTPILMHAKLNCRVEESGDQLTYSHFYSKGKGFVEMDLFGNGFQTYHRCSGP